MASTLETIYNSGSTIYAMIRRRSDGYVWNTTLNAGSGAFEAYAVGHWAQYAIALTEQASSGYYAGAFPTGIGGTFTSEVLYVRAGGTPASGDAPPFSLSLSQGQNAAAVGGVGLNASNMAAALSTQQLGSIVGTPASPLLLPTDLTNSHADAYAGRAVIMTSGALAQQASLITAYDGATFILTVNGFPSGLTPANADTFIIV